MKPPRTPLALALAGALVAITGCTLGSQILDVGKQCNSDDDCSAETECVRADAPSADKVCMPIDDEDPSESN